MQDLKVWGECWLIRDWEFRKIAKGSLGGLAGYEVG